MSSGFVSGGTNEEPIERDDEWQRVQQELEKERKSKADLGNQGDGRSLFDVLQQNKSELKSLVWSLVIGQGRYWDRELAGDSLG